MAVRVEEIPLSELLTFNLALIEAEAQIQIHVQRRAVGEMIWEPETPVAVVRLIPNHSGPEPGVLCVFKCTFEHLVDFKESVLEVGLANLRMTGMKRWRLPLQFGTLGIYVFVSDDEVETLIGLIRAALSHIRDLYRR